MKYLITCAIIAPFFLASCSQDPSAQRPQSADVIYYGGDILTMQGDSAQYVEAIVVDSGIIVFTGTKKEADDYLGDSTASIDLKGRTLLPGFLDAHGHISLYALVSQVPDLSPPPYGPINTITDIQNLLRKYISDNKIPPGTPILANGYDDAVLTGNRHPTVAELDAVSTQHPIFIEHTSGHMGVANSLFMKEMKIDYNTPDPEGGFIIRDEKTKKLTGKMVENANVNSLVTYAKLKAKFSKPVADSQRFTFLLRSEEVWLRNGQTTICDGRSSPGDIALIQEANQKGLLKGDFVVLPDYDMNKGNMNQLKQFYKNYNGHFKVGAMKLTFDGSPQGKSAWMTQPYLTPADGQKSDFKGEPIYTRTAAYAAMKDIFENGMQVNIHCNGDAAIDEGLSLLDSLKKSGLFKPEMRCVLVHAQLTRPNQVARIKELGVIPTWFPTHAYLWGDWHRDVVFGAERANHISPLNAGLKTGILFTIHHDAPVTPPDLITAVYAAVNRTTRSGKVLGADQKISPYEALKAITINAAYQWSEEENKGTLEKGKMADLVILDKNPLKVSPSSIREIQVVETIKEGKTVYRKD